MSTSRARYETFFKFDGEGNKVYEKDPLERVTTHRYDGLNRLIETHRTDLARS